MIGERVRFNFSPFVSPQLRGTLGVVAMTDRRRRLYVAPDAGGAIVGPLFPDDVRLSGRR